jgi:hypothetical protein
MQYISPFTQIGVTIDELRREPLLQNINVLKKRFLAEFELNRAISLHLPAGEFSKNDILLYFESILSSFPHHLLIAKDPVLLVFLETNQIKESFSDIYSDESFLSFIEPYFAHSFCQLGIQLLENQNLPTDTFSKIPLLVSSQFNSEFFNPLKSKINSFTTEIEEIASMINDANGIKPAGVYLQIYGHNTINVLNYLDNRIFGIEKVNYLNAAIRLINSCLKEDGDGFRNEELVEFVLSRIDKLESDISFKEEIKRLSSSLKKTLPKLIEEEKPNDFISFLLGLLILITAIYLIIKGIVFIFKLLF